jgi:hypothetical protein
VGGSVVDTLPSISFDSFEDAVVEARSLLGGLAPDALKSGENNIVAVEIVDHKGTSKYELRLIVQEIKR